MKNKGTDNGPKKEYLEVSRSLALQLPFSCFPLACKASGLHIQTSYALQLLPEICIFLQPPGSHIQNTTHPALLSSWPTQILLPLNSQLTVLFKSFQNIITEASNLCYFRPKSNKVCWTRKKERKRRLFWLWENTFSSVFPSLVAIFKRTKNSKDVGRYLSLLTVIKKQ